MYLDENGNLKQSAVKPAIHIYDHVVCDRAATEEVGEPQYTERPYITIKHKGYRDYISRPLREQDKTDYPEAWARYQTEKLEADQLGAPLDRLPAFTPSLGAELESRGISDIETLAEAKVLKKHQKIQKQAIAYLAMMEDDE